MTDEPKRSVRERLARLLRRSAPAAAGGAAGAASLAGQPGDDERSGQPPQTSQSPPEALRAQATPGASARPTEPRSRQRPEDVVADTPYVPPQGAESAQQGGAVDLPPPSDGTVPPAQQFDPPQPGGEVDLSAQTPGQMPPSRELDPVRTFEPPQLGSTVDIQRPPDGGGSVPPPQRFDPSFPGGSVDLSRPAKPPIDLAAELGRTDPAEVDPPPPPADPDQVVGVSPPEVAEQFLTNVGQINLRGVEDHIQGGLEGWQELYDQNAPRPGTDHPDQPVGNPFDIAVGTHEIITEKIDYQAGIDHVEEGVRGWGELLEGAAPPPPATAGASDPVDDVVDAVQDAGEEAAEQTEAFLEEAAETAEDLKDEAEDFIEDNLPPPPSWPDLG